MAQAIRRWCVLAACTAALVAPGCASDDSRQRGAPDGGNPDTDAGPIGGCDEAADADGDGISDAVEGDGDPDGDDAPNLRDADSDEDGIPDSEERRTEDGCVAKDSDFDGTPDFLDTDSDNDGLPDSAERELGTDPTDIDSDGDGVSDLGEARGTGTDPLDPADTIPPEDFFVVLPYQGDPESRTLRFNTSIEIADVFFLVDMTGSMQGERTNLIRGLLDVIIPGIEAAVDDVQFGVGGFDDYPTGSYGAGSDLPFYLLQRIAPPDRDAGEWSIDAGPLTCPRDSATRDIGTIEGAPNGKRDILEAVEGLPCHSGADGPESYVPALWSTATGNGLSWPGGSVPDQSCPVIPDETGVRRGYPCFRPEALPIVLLFGDAVFHNGPEGEHPYDFEAPEYAEAVSELDSLGARVIGIFSGGVRTGSEHYAQIAADTGSVRADGTPLVFEIADSGIGLDTTVVDAVDELVSGTPQDVTTETRNVPGNPDELDATQLIESITTIEGYTPSGDVGGYADKDDHTFYEVTPGTTVDFEVVFHNEVREPGDTAEIFEARILVIGNDVTTLDSRHVYIIVPPEGDSILI